VECRHAAGNAREPGAHLIGGAKAEIRNAAATTSRCVGSDKVASRSGDRPAIIPSRPQHSSFCGLRAPLRQSIFPEARGRQRPLLKIPLVPITNACQFEPGWWRPPHPLPDFYGPSVHVSTLQNALNEAASGKTVNWLGRADTQREYIYVPDAMRIAAAVMKPVNYDTRKLLRLLGPQRMTSYADGIGETLTWISSSR
jgi:hypothetical protein